MRKIILLSFVYWCGMNLSLSWAQDIRFDPARVIKEEKQIFIPYRILEGKKIEGKYLYLVRAFYSQDRGKSYQEITDASTYGLDLGDSLLPGSKEIIWNYYAQNPAFDGQNVWFKLDVATDLNPFAVSGPEGALYSLLLPGLGNTKVRHFPKLWYLNTIASFSLIGSGIYMRNRSNQTYDKYLQAQNISDTQSLFDKSNNQRLTGSILILSGIGVWAADVVRVYLKGKKNKKAQKKALENPVLREKYGTKLSLDYNYGQDFHRFSLGLKF